MSHELFKHKFITILIHKHLAIISASMGLSVREIFKLNDSNKLRLDKIY